jgi:transcriptional regulator GlxA family with amidase domain
VLGVRFHPDGAAAVLREPQHALAGLTLGVDALSSALARRLTDVCSDAASVTDAVGLVQDSLARGADPLRLDPRVRRVVDQIRRRRGQVVVEALAQEVGLTRRHLERRFLQLVGMSPKRLARIARFQHAVGLLTRCESAQRGTDTAARCGYADQAHLIRDFREFAGCPPGEHLLRQAELSGFFTEPTP